MNSKDLSFRNSLSEKVCVSGHKSSKWERWLEAQGLLAAQACGDLQAMSLVDHELKCREY
jgi:hypothetical protein